MSKRKSSRLATVDQRVDYRHAQGQGSGTVMNLSTQGCRINGAFLFPCGTRLRLTLSLPGEVDAVGVDRAAVRWVKDHHFGVTFLELTSDAQQRIERVIARLEKTQQPAAVEPQEQMIPGSAFMDWDFSEADEPEIRTGR